MRTLYAALSILSLAPWLLWWHVHHPTAGFAGFERILGGVVPTSYLSGTLLLVGCFFFVTEFSRIPSSRDRIRQIFSVVIAAVGGGPFLYLFFSGDLTGNNFVVRTAHGAAVTAELGLVIYLLRKWRARLGVMLLGIHAVTSNISFWGSVLRPLTRSDLVVQHGEQLGLVSSLALGGGLLSIYLWLREKLSRAP